MTVFNNTRRATRNRKIMNALSETAHVERPMHRERIGTQILGTRIDAIDWTHALAQIEQWARARTSSYICICNVHVLMSAARDERFRAIINQADLATPDGMPLAWTLRARGFAQQERINGPDLMWRYCERAAERGLSIFLYGSTPLTLNGLSVRLRRAFPGLKIAGVCSPPFRALSAEEDEKIVASINRSGAGVVFVGLGCPKQEMWMAAHRGAIEAVMIGVGAAFDYHAGTLRRAPEWMQRRGLEWLHRLAHDPRRLWRRYLVTNTLFVLRVAVPLLCQKLLLFSRKKLRRR